MTRVFVTGASGYIGGALTTRLIERGDTVVGLARSDTAARKVAARGAHRLVPVVLGALRERDPDYRLHVAASAQHEIPADLLDRRVTVRRATGEVVEPQIDVIPDAELATEWEWEQTPEVSLVCAHDDEAAIEIIDRHSPRFVASILTRDAERLEAFVRRIDAPYVGNAFTRWVDGQWAWGRPELGLTNWERGRLMGRSGILTGEDVFSVREVFTDHSGEASQER
jgi:glutamate-5-semialdehyde dehydrogenase